MKTKLFSIIRLEESTVVKRITYDIVAPNKNAAVKKLKSMDYEIRDTIDEIREDNWNPREIVSIYEYKECDAETDRC